MLQPGTTLDDKYQVEAVIGRGGFGYVYRARERLTGEAVAVKELVPGFVDDPQMVQRFIQEAGDCGPSAMPVAPRSSRD